MKTLILNYKKNLAVILGCFGWLGLVLPAAEAQYQPSLSLQGSSLEAPIHGVAISRDSRYIASARFQPVIWDAQSGEKIKEFPADPLPVDSLEFTPDGKMLLVGVSPWSAKLYDVKTGALIHTFETYTKTEPHDPRTVQLGGVTAMDFSSDGKRLLTGDVDGAIQLWDMQTKKEIRRYRNLSRVINLKFLPSNQTFFVDEIGLGRIWNVYTEETIQVLPAGVMSLSSNRNWLIDRANWTLQVWNLMSLQKVKEYASDRDYFPQSVAISPDGKLTLEAGAVNQSAGKVFPRTLKDSENNSEKRKYPLSTSTTKNSPDAEDQLVQFFPHGRAFLTVNGNTIHIWNIDDLTSSVKDPAQY